MSFSLRTLPIIEHWDCHACGNCCRGTVIPLNDDDLRKLKDQRWEEHPEYRGVLTVLAHGLFHKTRFLAQRHDGSCVFLTQGGRCRIHEEHGADAKPLVCRRFPLQVVPLDTVGLLTLRRSCPSAAVDRGRPVDQHRDDLRRLFSEERERATAVPLNVVRGLRRAWKDFLAVAGFFERFLLDERFPLVRRLAHGLTFATLLEQCRLRKLNSKQLNELLLLLEPAAVQESRAWFRERAAPRRVAGALFRQTAAEYSRLHPKFSIRQTWLARWRLATASISFVYGRGQVPRLVPTFPATTFESLDRPLDTMSEEVWRPLYAYFTTVAASKQYALLGRRGWSLTESFRSLALTYPLALWLLRWACGDRPPEAADMIEIVTALDRGQGYAPLSGHRHRQRVAAIERQRQLGPLVVWHGR